MEEENKINNNAAEQDPAQAQDQTQTEQGERLFTQDEVNEIIRKRLAKEKAKAPAETEQPETALNDAALTARSNYLDCKEYLINSNLSLDLLDVIDTSDAAVFISKVEKLQLAKPPKLSYPKLKDAGEVLHAPDPDAAIRSAFSNTAHKPKEFKY